MLGTRIQYEDAMRELCLRNVAEQEGADLSPTRLPWSYRLSISPQSTVAAIDGQIGSEPPRVLDLQPLTIAQRLR